jgi:hypothetical protein
MRVWLRTAAALLALIVVLTGCNTSTDRPGGPSKTTEAPAPDEYVVSVPGMH